MKKIDVYSVFRDDFLRTFDKTHFLYQISDEKYSCFYPKRVNRMDWKHRKPQIKLTLKHGR